MYVCNVFMYVCLYKLNNFFNSSDAFSYPMSVDNFEVLAQVEGYLANSYLSSFERIPHSLTELWSKELFLEQVRTLKNVKKIYEDMKTIYGDAHENGLRIELDNFGGFGLFNRSKKTIRVGVIDFSVGLIEKCTKNRKIDDWSAMEGEKMLVGVARWANHSCLPNCQYYMSGGFRGRVCVRLRAIKEIKDGEELLVFYRANWFGQGNIHCLCGNSSEHKNDEKLLLSLDREDMCLVRRKKKKVAKLAVNNTSQEGLTGLVEFYCELSNASVDSVDQETSQENQQLIPDESATDPAFFSDENISIFSEDVSSENNNSIEVAMSSAVDSSDEEMKDSSAENDQYLSFSDELDSVFIDAVKYVSASNLAASLLTIVSKHNCSDALLHDLLKRDQIIFSGQTLSPYAVKSKLQEVCLRYYENRVVTSNGEVVLVNFYQSIKDIVVNNIRSIFQYAETKEDEKDIMMPKPSIVDNELTIRLILNSDGAVVAKTPSTSAWPVLIAIADLPPFKRQSFENLVLGALFVGNGSQILMHFFLMLKKSSQKQTTSCLVTRK